MKMPNEFWSIENMAANTEKQYPIDDMTIVGEKIYGPEKDHKHVLMVDPAGMGWYETRILRGGKWVSPEVAIFGQQIKRKRRSA